MNILVACEESQRVCVAFRDKGHNAFSCDIQSCSGGHPEWHIKGDVLQYINGASDDFCRADLVFYTEDGSPHLLPWRWDMIIAFPPCTYFSRVNFFNYFRKGVFNQKRFDESKFYVDFFLAIFNANCDKICIENPVPIFLFNDILPPYTMILQPYEFGESFSKKTCLWLKGLPYLIPTCICTKYESYVKINGNIGGDIKNIKDQSKYRSKTFLGVAKAMAAQWG